jgi:hypothetical protein
MFLWDQDHEVAREGTNNAKVIRAGEDALSGAHLTLYLSLLVGPSHSLISHRILLAIRSHSWLFPRLYLFLTRLPFVLPS